MKLAKNGAKQAYFLNGGPFLALNGRKTNAGPWPKNELINSKCRPKMRDGPARGVCIQMLKMTTHKAYLYFNIFISNLLISLKNLKV